MGRTGLPLGAIILGAVLGLAGASLAGVWWSGQEAYPTVSEAMARHQGTGSLAGLDRAISAATVYLLGAAIPVLPAAWVGASRSPRRGLSLAALVLTVTVASLLGFAFAAGTGGRDLASDAWLHGGYETYTVLVRRGSDLPPLSESELQGLELPAFLADEATPASSPVIGGLHYLLTAVTLGALFGYGVGNAYRGHRRSPPGVAI